MSWGIDFDTHIFISRESCKTIGEVDSRIEELQDELQLIKEKLLIFSSSNDFTRLYPDYDDPALSLREEISGLFNWMQTNCSLISKLQLYREHLTENS